MKYDFIIPCDDEKMTNSSMTMQDYLLCQETKGRDYKVDSNMKEYFFYNGLGQVASGAMMLYVIQKQIIFNGFAEVKLPLDMWS